MLSFSENIIFCAVFCEQVVAVFVLVIERKTTNFVAETKINAQGTLLDIPLACFLLGKLFVLKSKLILSVTHEKSAIITFIVLPVQVHVLFVKCGLTDSCFT